MFRLQMVEPAGQTVVLYNEQQQRETFSRIGLLLRGVAKGEPTARLARELGLSRQTVHTLRQRVQDNVNGTAP